MTSATRVWTRCSSAAVLLLTLGTGPYATAAEIEEIVVTARATEESVRDIPVAITAVAEERLNQFGLESFEDLEALTPQVAIGRGTSGSGAVIAIRGIGSSSTSIGIEQSVAVDHRWRLHAAGTRHQRGAIRYESGRDIEGPAGVVFR